MNSKTERPDDEPGTDEGRYNIRDAVPALPLTLIDELFAVVETPSKNFPTLSPLTSPARSCRCPLSRKFISRHPIRRSHHQGHRYQYWPLHRRRSPHGMTFDRFCLHNVRLPLWYKSPDGYAKMSYPTVFSRVLVTPASIFIPMTNGSR